VALALLPLVGLTLGTALVGSRPAAEPFPAAISGPPAAPEPELREELLATYARSRRATWLVTFEYHRRTAAGGRLDLRLTELNRPPDHLSSGLGGLNGRVGDRQVVCTDVDGRRLCAPSGPVVPFEDELAAQLGELRDVLQPPAKWYAVEAAPARRLAGEPAACYGLRRIADVPDPPYGERAEYCFAADGAPLLTRIERREGTDERVAATVTRQVGDGDVHAMLAEG
jgi:hypothetical protein